MGGAATNSGIDFQARVGAFAMVSMFAEVQELTALGLADSGMVDRVHFETGDDIDDLMLANGPRRSFINAKRTISMSAEEDSEFSSVIGQFVRQHVQDPGSGSDTFVLATTSGASSRITTVLKKLTEATRLNRGHEVNPTTKTEESVRDDVYSQVDRHFAAITGRTITDAERAEILAKIHVQVLDVEAGAPLERAALSVLAARGVPSASAAWAELISLALTLAKDRLSIDTDGLMARLRHVLTLDEDAEPHLGADSAVRSALDGDLPVALEVLLYEEEGRTLLAELHRFDEQGRPRLRFEDGRVTFPARGPFDVTRRAASMAGMERILGRNPELVESDELFISEAREFPAEDAPGIEEHRQVARQLLSDNPDILTCLRCGRTVSEDQAPYVEVDELGEPPEVGLVHWGCLRPLHRVLGGISGEGLAHNDMLGDFDYRTWLGAVISGQGLFNQLGAQLRTRMSPIAWEPRRSHLSTGTWGVLLQHADGEEHFTTKRGMVETLSEAIARERAHSFNDALDQAKEEGDPFCVSPETQISGTYTTLLKVASNEGMPIEITRAVPREMSRAALQAEQRADNYYAPLLALIELDKNEVFAPGGAVFLITDPLALPDMVANWRAAGIDVPTLGTAVLANDDQVDALIASRGLRGELVFVDPRLGLDAKPVSGAWFDTRVLWLSDLTDTADRATNDWTDGGSQA